MEEAEFAALIGIDWGDHEHHVVVWDVEDRTTTERAVEQTPEALHAWMSALMNRYAGRSIAIAVEQSRGALVYALMNYAGVVLYPVNPNLSRYRDAFRRRTIRPTPSSWRTFCARTEIVCGHGSLSTREHVRCGFSWKTGAHWSIREPH